MMLSKSAKSIETTAVAVTEATVMPPAVTEAVATEQLEITVWFDLDETLFINAVNQDAAELCYTESLYSDQRLNLSKTKLYDEAPCYLIFLQRSKELFEFLQSQEDAIPNKKVTIDFITAGTHKRERVLPFLESAYGLKEGSLQKCRFINADMLGDAYTPKGMKLSTVHAYYKSKFPHLIQKVILVDDNAEHTRSAEEHGFIAIEAKNKLTSRKFNFDYLDKTREIVSKLLNEVDFTRAATSVASDISTTTSEDSIVRSRHSLS